MTKRHLLFAFLMALIAYYWWHEAKPPEPLQSDKHPSHSQPSALAKTPREESHPLQKTAEASPQNHHQKSQLLKSLKATTLKTSPDAVPFQNYKGMAIAYGDVLLGNLQENITSGFTYPPEINLWPSAVIPYHIQPNVPNPSRIQQALRYLSDKTILQFIPYEDGIVDAIVFEPTDENCFSYVGRISGTQPIFISSGCHWYHIVHEILHAIGFIHEHSRPDRDQFITIQWDNIPESYRSQFEIMPDSLIRDWLRYDYDSQSIMHYSSQIFAQRDDAYSLLRKDGSKVPETHELSAMDIQKINDLFNGR